MSLSNTEKKERQRDKRLQDTYRWSLERRNRLAKSQNNECAICGRIENPGHPLNLDHEHFKITYIRFPVKDIEGTKWVAEIRLKDGRYFQGRGATKIQAKNSVREKALPASVRGLLCPGRRGCNRRLGWVDDLNFLESAILYLKNPPARNILTNPTQTDTLNP